MYKPITTRWGKRQTIIARIIFAIVMVIMCARLFPIFAYFYAGTPLFDPPKEQSSGPSRPLALILDVAEKKAHSIDKDVVLSGIDFHPVGYLDGAPYTTPATESLEFTFSYLRPDGREIRISLEDSDPASTIEFFADDTSADTRTGLTTMKEAYLRDRGELPGYKALLNSYKLTPRDAVAQTWADSSNYISKQIVAKEQVLPAISTGSSDTGTPVWNVDYFYYHKGSARNHNGIFEFGFSVVSYVINGETGK